MNRAKVFINGVHVGFLVEVEKERNYYFQYLEGYKGDPVSLTMPSSQQLYLFDRFPPFFEGLLPEGVMLDALLKRGKVDRNDLFQQLIVVGHDLVGNVTVEKET